MEKRLPERLPPVSLEAPDAQEFHRRYPTATFMAAIEQRRRRTRPRQVRALGVASAAALAVALVLFVGLPDPADRHLEPSLQGQKPFQDPRGAPDRSGATDRQPDRQDRAGGQEFGLAGDQVVKGTQKQETPIRPIRDPRLHVRVRRDSTLEEVADGQTLRADDVLQFAYDASQWRYLYVLSIERSGAINSYFPATDGASIPIAGGPNVPLPDAVQLDDYVGPERFFGLFSKTPIATSEVVRAVRNALAMLAEEGKGVRELSRLPLDCHQMSVLVEKK